MQVKFVYDGPGAGPKLPTGTASSPFPRVGEYITAGATGTDRYIVRRVEWNFDVRTVFVRIGRSDEDDDGLG